MRNWKMATARIPTVLFLDRKGTVRYVGNGVPSDYSEQLETILAENDQRR